MPDFEDLLSPEQLQELREAERRRKYRRENSGYYRRQAEAIVDLQMRDAIWKWKREGLSTSEIATRLGQHRNTIAALKRRSIKEAVRRYRYDQAQRQSRTSS